MKVTNSLDSKAKSIIANKSLIATILRNEVKEYNDLSISEIEDLIEQGDGDNLLGIGNEDDFSGNKRIRYDLLITPRLPNSDEKIGMYINVEMQNTSDDRSLLTRAIYYASSLISRQPKDIGNFTYQKLKKVYSIWICVSPKANRRNTVIDYSITPKQIYGNNVDDLGTSDILNIRFLNLSNNKPNNNETLDILRLIFMPTGLTSKEVSSALQDNYDIIMTEKEVSDMPGFGQFVYDSEFEEGINKGIQQGLADGTKQTLVSNIVKLVHHGMSTKEAFDTLEVPDDIQKIALEELEKEK